MRSAKLLKGVQGNIISIDETHFDNRIANNYGWSEKGKKIILKKYFKHFKRYTLICAISNRKILHTKIIKDSANGETFLKFIEELIGKIDENKYLLMDNARIHHTKRLKEYVAKNNHKIIYNVPYSPEYNPIEKVFSKLKSMVRRKENNYKEEKLMTNIKNGLRKIKEKDLENFYRKSLAI